MSGHASRRAELGQHFLAGAWLAAELAEQAGVGAGDLYDPRLAERARARLAGFGNVRVVTADALALPMPRRPFRVVANPPFGSTKAILRRLLGDPLVPPFTYRQLRRLARELGFRLDARPADLDAVQWAGLYAFLARPPHLGRRAQSP